MSSTARTLASRRLIGSAILLACALGAAHAGAQSKETSGFFTGLRLVPQAADAPRGAWSFAPPGLKLGQALEFSRPADTANPLPNGTTAFGGYQFDSGLALGAAINTTASRSLLEPQARSGAADGVGLRFDASRWALPTHTNTVNVDVVSAFNYRNYLSVYGKVGVGRTDAKAGDANFLATPVERTSLSYGLGVRYDFSPNVGLKLELSRGTRFGLGLKTFDEPDTLNLGVRWSF